MADQDLSLLLFVVVATIAWGGVWGLLGGAVSRMAAVHIASGRREPASRRSRSRAATSRDSPARAPSWRSACWARSRSRSWPRPPRACPAGSGRSSRSPGSWWRSCSRSSPSSRAASRSWRASCRRRRSPWRTATRSTPSPACSGTPARACRASCGSASCSSAGVLLGVLWRGLRTAVAIVVGALVVHAGAGRVRFERWTGRARRPGRGRRRAPARPTSCPGSCSRRSRAGSWRSGSPTPSRASCARGSGPTSRCGRRSTASPPTGCARRPAARGRVDAEEAGFVEVGRIGSDAAARAR